VQTRERQMRLGLDARGRQHLMACRPAMVRGRPQQRGFPDTRIADHDDRCAAVGGLVNEAGQDPEFLIPANQALRGYQRPALGI
jgi:hypothetical protein